jgi:hypothetical protein
MRKIEVVLILLALTGIILKFYSIEGGALLTAVSFISLFVLYFVGAFILLNGIPANKIFKSSTYSTIGWRKMLWSVLSGIVLAYAVLGILFSILSWYGAGVVLMNATVLLLPVLIISLVFAVQGSKLNQNILLRSAVVLIIAVYELTMLLKLYPY